MALAVLAALAGCADGGGSPLTAKQGASTASRVAAAWAPDALLHSAFSVEFGDDRREELRDELRQEQEGDGAFEETLDEGERAMMDAVLESHDSPGDGVAPFWAYTYVSANRSMALTVLVGRDGVLHTEEEPFDPGQSEPIGNWTLDSDEMAAAAAGVEGYSALQGDPGTSAFSVLLAVGGEPYWLTALEGDEGGDVEVAMSARNGTLTTVEDIFGFGGLLTVMEWGSASGSLTALQGPANEAFVVEQDSHQRIAIAVEVSGPMLGPAEVTVTDGDGFQSTFTVPATTAGLASRASTVLDSVPAGAWMVVLQMDLALEHSYTVEWCTDGLSTDFGFNSACDEVLASAAAEPRDAGRDGAAASWMRGETISPWAGLRGA